MNVWCLKGRLTNDPETRNVGDSSVTGFSVAYNIKFGEKERVSFFDVKAWGKTGEFVAKHFSKGKEILLSGRAEQETWEKDGQKRSKIVMVAERADFCGWDNRGEEGQTDRRTAAPATRAAARPPREGDVRPMENILNDGSKRFAEADIPF